MLLSFELVKFVSVSIDMISVNRRAQVNKGRKVIILEVSTIDNFPSKCSGIDNFPSKGLAVVC